MKGIWFRITAIVAGIAALLLMSGVMSPSSHALTRYVTWGYELRWNGPSNVLVVDEYGGGGVSRKLIVSGVATAVGVAHSGELIGVDPDIGASPGVTAVACTLVVNDVAVLSDSAVRGDGTDVSCLWLVS